MSDTPLHEVLRKASEAIERGQPEATSEVRAALVEPFKPFKGPDGQLYVTVPVEPSKELLTSMALRYNHGLFMPAMENDFFSRTEEERTREIESTMTTMRQLHEEVVGTGFYKPDKDAYYRSFTAPTRRDPTGDKGPSSEGSGS